MNTSVINVVIFPCYRFSGLATGAIQSAKRIDIALRWRMRTGATTETGRRIAMPASVVAVASARNSGS